MWPVGVGSSLRGSLLSIQTALVYFSFEFLNSRGPEPRAFVPDARGSAVAVRSNTNR